MTREEAIDFLIAGYPDSCYEGLREAFDMAIKALQQPERKNGKWVRDEFGSVCSCCGLYAYRDKFGEPWESNFCPNCGVEMEEK